MGFYHQKQKPINGQHVLLLFTVSAAGLDKKFNMVDELSSLALLHRTWCYIQNKTFLKITSIYSKDTVLRLKMIENLQHKNVDMICR